MSSQMEPKISSKMSAKNKGQDRGQNKGQNEGRSKGQNKGQNNGLTNSWLSSSLKISPEEQIVFLQKLLDNKLPVSLKSHYMTKNILYTDLRTFKGAAPLRGLPLEFP